MRNGDYYFSLEWGGTHGGSFSYDNGKIYHFTLSMVAGAPLVGMPIKDSTKLCFQIGMSTRTINNNLKKYKFPFEYLEDSLSNKSDLYYKTKKKMKKVFSTSTNIEYFLQINHKQRKYYLIQFRDSAEYDFFILVQQSPFKLFKSEDYNVKQNWDYIFLDASLNLKDKNIKIELNHSQGTKTIQFVPHR